MKREKLETQPAPPQLKSSEPDEKSKALATLMLDRQERMKRCAEVVQKALEKDRCTLFAPVSIVDGRIVVPSIEVRAMD